MNSDDDERAKEDLMWQTWQDGISKVGSSAAVKLFRGDQPMGDEELFQGWLETIDRMMEIALSPEDFEELKWHSISSDQKRETFEGVDVSFKKFVDTIEMVISVMMGGERQQADKVIARKIIVEALSRAANQDIEDVFDIDPGKGLMSSEQLVELGLNRDKLIECLLQDQQVISADCVEGEFLVGTTDGEIQFRLVFSDEAKGGHS